MKKTRNARDHVATTFCVAFSCGEANVAFLQMTQGTVAPKVLKPQLLLNCTRAIELQRDCFLLNLT